MIVDLHQGGFGCNESRRCENLGCHKTTRHKKPYCLDHVEEHPYARGIVDHLERRIEERKLAAQNKLRDPRGQLARELIHLLGETPRTIKRVARDLRLNHAEAEGVCLCLRRARLVSLGRTPRGATTVALRQRQRA